MNKRKVEALLPQALAALNDTHCRIVENNKISKTYRGQISSFGAAITMGSFKAAVAFFSVKADNGTGVDRSRLIAAMNFIVHGQWKDPSDILKNILNLSGNQLNEEREAFINAALALKLAMNAFELVS